MGIFSVCKMSHVFMKVRLFPTFFISNIVINVSSFCTKQSTVCLLVSPKSIINLSQLILSYSVVVLTLFCPINSSAP